MCKLISITSTRKEIVDQFPIADRDEHIYVSIDEAVEDALRRSFKDINFRTMSATKENNGIKKVLEQINGPKKINNFDIVMVDDAKEKEAITNLIDMLKNNTLKYEDCKITEYLIVCLKKEGFVKRFVDYFDCNTYKDEAAFYQWHNKTAEMFLNVLERYYKDAYYGKAQKIVNMMFKHLYCMNFGQENSWKVLQEEYFWYCHMPLDSFTLDWLKRKDNTAVCEWSNLKYNSVSKNGQASTSYVEYLERVKKLFPINGLTAFKAEFYIWPQMQVTQAFEAIYRMNHTKVDTEKFKQLSISQKCNMMVSEIGNMNFIKDFI